MLFILEDTYVKTDFTLKITVFWDIKAFNSEDT